ncbi:cytochrome P450 [Halopelagius longus]|uniref:Cytochrome P450 n=1 Tax=Halopelagius longus TaxID=1236180 RepID=A0A1H1AWJ9_9EURY|nr:cytochrome P450 [Halopelagius longus]RDI70543.1 cytochrome P450 [Halopelagius longus]SDQ44040.1 Cytochrome P450 [Halopelagius longus]
MSNIGSGSSDSSEGSAPRGGEDLPSKTPPGPDGLPVVGNVRSLVRDPRGFYDEMSEYGNVVSYRLPGMKFCTVLHPELIERVLMVDYDRYAKWGFEDFGGEFAPEGLVLTDGEQWRRQRTTIQNAFTVERIRSYGDTMARGATEMINEWDDGEEIALNRAFSKLTLDVLTRSLFDLKLSEETGIVTEFAETFNDRGSIDGVSTFLPMWIPTPENRRYKRVLSEFRSFVEGLIDERRGRADEYDDLLSLLLTAEDDDGNVMSETEIRDQMVTFLFAGHETTSLALTYTFLELAKNPSVRDRLDAEHSSVLGGGAPELGDLDNLSYSERVIQESLRLYPPAFILLRKATEDTELGGYRIPKGTRLTLPPFYVHTDERWYDAPESFDPSRWTEGFEDSLPDYAYFPFGGGPRHCIGMRFAMLELKIVLAIVAQSVEFELLSDPEPELDMATTLRPAEDIRMRVSKS